jgi:hypothetical protein
MRPGGGGWSSPSAPVPACSFAWATSSGLEAVRCSLGWPPSCCGGSTTSERICGPCCAALRNGAGSIEACGPADWSGPGEDGPHIERIRSVPDGIKVIVRSPLGQHAGHLDNAAPSLEAALRVREVRVARQIDDASLVRLTVVRRDPLAGGPPLEWPWHGRQQTSVWDPVPVGVDEEGTLVLVGWPSTICCWAACRARASRSCSTSWWQPPRARPVDKSQQLLFIDEVVNCRRVRIARCATWGGTTAFHYTERGAARQSHLWTESHVSPRYEWPNARRES